MSVFFIPGYKSFYAFNKLFVFEIYINYCPEKVPENFGRDRAKSYVREPRMVQLMLAFERKRKYLARKKNTSTRQKRKTVRCRYVK